MKVKEVMNKVIVIDHDVNLRQAAQIMSNKNIGSLIVLKSSKIVGIVTERDVMKNISYLSKKISTVMSKNVVTMDHNETLDNAALIMTEKKVKRLPITDKGKLVGIVTATDIIANSDVLNEDFLID
jgi:CBS domain-containing protein